MYIRIIRETSASLKLYNRELSSTIDRYKNGKNAYMYSDWLGILGAYQIMHSRLYVDKLLCQVVHENAGQTAHTIICQTRSLSGWTASLLLCLSLPDLLFIEGDDVHPPSTTSITTSRDQIRLGQFCIWTTWWPFLSCCYFTGLLRGGLTCECG